MQVMGVDEAGRGCVLGSLVIGAFITEHDDDTLRRAGAADSKALTAARRQERLGRLTSLGTVDRRVITAPEIDAGNLNTLEEDAIADLIVAHRPEIVRIDALGHPRTLHRSVDRLLAAAAARGVTVRIEMTPKADALWPTVGAASIAAKLHRDALLDALREEWGDFGSGYPSDPATRRWLTSRLGSPWPPFVRTRWATLDRLGVNA